MPKVIYPLNVALMDDDFYALKWNTALLMRDPRTTVVLEAETPQELIDHLGKDGLPEVVLLDIEYGHNHLSLEELFRAIRARAPQVKIVCSSQYGDSEVISASMALGAAGFLLKQEVRMEIVSALLYAARTGTIVTQTIFDHLPSEYTFGHKQAHILPAWQPNPRLTPQIIKSFWLRVFFGMRASLAADELFVETATVERYINQAYKVLTDGWADDSFLFGLDLANLSAEDQAFIWFTLPPNGL